MSWRQYRALVVTFLRIAWRGPVAPDGARRRRIAFAGGFLGYLVVGVVMMFLSAAAPDPRFGGLVLQSMSFMMVALALLNIYGDLVFDARDVPLLFWRPLDPRAYFAARLTAIAVYFAAVTTALNLPGALVLATRVGPAWYVLAHLAGAFSGALAAILLALFLLFVLLKAIGRERLRDTVALVQIAATFLFLGGNQLLARADVFHASVSAMFVGKPAFFLPMAWGQAIADLISGRALPGQPAVALVGLLAPLCMALFLVVLFGRSYVNILQALGEGEAKREAPASRGVLRPWFERAASGDAAVRAGFLLTWATIRRARDYKVRALPQFGMPVIFILMAFVSQGSHTSVFLTLTVPAMLAVAGCNALVILVGSEKAEAAWVWRLGPRAAPVPAMRGAALAILGALVLPFLVVLAAASLVAVAPLDGVGLVAVSAALSVWALRLLHEWLPYFPCTISIEEMRRKRLGLEVVVIFFVATLCDGVVLWLRGRLGAWAYAPALPLLFWGWRGLAPRR